jgi:hypothetical protein
MGRPVMRQVGATTVAGRRHSDDVQRAVDSVARAGRRPTSISEAKKYILLAAGLLSARRNSGIWPQSEGRDVHGGGRRPDARQDDKNCRRAA